MPVLLDAISPGDIIREEFMEPLCITVPMLATDLKVSEDYLQRLLDGKVELSTEVAKRLAKRFGTSRQLWLNLQASYETDLAKGLPHA